MKKLSNRLSVKQSSTKEGQRELIREHTNKINEIIEALEKNPRLVYVVEEKPYTAMRSTGACKNPIYSINEHGDKTVTCGCKQSSTVSYQVEKDVNKSQEEIRKDIYNILMDLDSIKIMIPSGKCWALADKIIKIFNEKH